MLEFMGTHKDWSVYMVRCQDGSLYTGCSNDVEKRVAHHNAGKGAKYTAARRPVKLVFCEGLLSKEEAMRREYRMKQLPRKEKLTLLLTQRNRI